MTTLESLIKEFDEKFSDKDFCCCGREYCYPEDNANYEPIIKIKSFINQSLRELLDQVIPKGYDTEGTGLDIYQEKYEDGFNACRSKVEERIKKVLQ